MSADPVELHRYMRRSIRCVAATETFIDTFDRLAAARADLIAALESAPPAPLPTGYGSAAEVVDFLVGPGQYVMLSRSPDPDESLRELSAWRRELLDLLNDVRNGVYRDG